MLWWATEGPNYSLTPAENDGVGRERALSAPSLSKESCLIWCWYSFTGYGPLSWSGEPRRVSWNDAAIPVPPEMCLVQCQERKMFFAKHLIHSLVNPCLRSLGKETLYSGVCSNHSGSTSLVTQSCGCLAISIHRSRVSSLYSMSFEIKMLCDYTQSLKQ